MKDMSPETRQLIERARHADDPEVGARHRIEGRLSRRLTIGAGIVTSGAAVAKSATGASLVVVGAKSAAAVLVVGAALITGYGLLKPAPERSPRTSEHALPRPNARREAPPERALPAPLPASQASSGAGESEPAAAEKPAVKRTPAAAVREQEPAAPSESGVEAEAPARTAEDALVAETAALGSAQRAMRAGDPATAIRLLSAQDVRYPGGALQQERSAARVLALCQAGRISEARARAQAFQLRWPRSPLTAKVISACAER